MSRLLPLASSIVLALSASGASSQQAPANARDKQIAGEWEGNVSALGATARMTLNLFNDGTYVKRVVFVNEYGWTAVGNTLLIAPSVRYGDSLLFAKAMSMDMKVTDSSLITKSGKDSLKLRRFTYPVAQSPLLGRWQGQTEFGEELTEDFTADGRLIVSITLTHEAGRYSVDKGNIEWWQQIPESRKRREKFEIDGDKLKVFLGPKVPALELTRSSNQLVLN